MAADGEQKKKLAPLNVEALSFETVGKLNDGLVSVAIDDAISRAKGDLFARRRLDKPRKVTVELVFDPLMDASGAIEDVEILVTVKTSLPSVLLGSRAMVSETDGELDVVFKGAVPENPRQGHLDEVKTDHGV